MQDFSIVSTKAQHCIEQWKHFKYGLESAQSLIENSNPCQEEVTYFLISHFIGIGNFENKENFFVEPTEFHQIYGISKLNFDKWDFDESESNETCKNYGMFQQLQSSSNPNDISEKDMKTQNTQDYRKQTDLGIEEFDINFSGKKDLDRLIRYNLYNKPNDVEKHLDDIISWSVSYATNKRKEHSTKIHSR